MLGVSASETKVREPSAPRSLLAMDRLREAKRRFVSNSGFSPSAALCDSRKTSSLRPFTSIPHRVRTSSSGGSSRYTHHYSRKQRVTTATSSSDVRRSLHHSSPFISGISNIPRHIVGGSDANSILTWTVPDSTRHSASLIVGPPEIMPSPLTAASANGGAERADASGSLSPHLHGACTNSSGGSDDIVLDALQKRYEGQTSDMLLYDQYRKRCEMRRQEMFQREASRCERRDAVCGGLMSIISKTARLNYTMKFQSKIHTYSVQRQQGTLGVTGSMGATLKVAGEATKAQTEGQKLRGSGMQVALALLKSGFAVGHFSSATSAAVPKKRPPSAATPKSLLMAAESRLHVDKKSPIAVRETAEDMESCNERCAAHIPLATPLPSSARPSNGADNGMANNTIFSIDSGKAPTMMYDSLNNQNAQNKPHGPGKAFVHQQHLTQCEGCLTDEEKYALELLSTVRVLRRQTEDLTAAILHATGEWGCWKTPGSSFFSGLFMSLKRGDHATHEEKRLELQVMQMNAGANGDTGQTHPLAMALLHLHPFRRMLPLPPRASVQLQMFSLQRGYLNMLKKHSYSERPQQRERDVEQTAVKRVNDLKNSSLKLQLQQLLLPDEGKNETMSDMGSTQELPIQTELDDCFQKDISPQWSNIHFEAQMVKEVGKVEGQDREPPSFCAVEGKISRPISSLSLSPSSSTSSSSSTVCSHASNSTENTEEETSNFSVTSLSAPPIGGSNGIDSVAVVPRSDATSRKEHETEDGVESTEETFPRLTSKETSPAGNMEVTGGAHEAILDSRVAQPASSVSPGASVEPVFHAEQVFERKPRHRSKLKSMAISALKFFSWGGMCSSRRGATAHRRRS